MNLQDPLQLIEGRYEELYKMEGFYRQNEGRTGKFRVEYFM